MEGGFSWDGLLLYAPIAHRLGKELVYGHGSKPMVPFWDRCITHFRTYCSNWDVHWGYGVLTHGHIASFQCQKAPAHHFSNTNGLRRRKHPLPAAVSIVLFGKIHEP